MVAFVMYYLNVVTLLLRISISVSKAVALSESFYNQKTFESNPPKLKCQVIRLSLALSPSVLIPISLVDVDWMFHVLGKWVVM